MHAGLETCMRDARYSQLRSGAYAAVNAVVKSNCLTGEQLGTLKNTIHERAKSETNPALHSQVEKIVSKV